MTNRKTPVPQSYPTLDFEVALRSLRTNKARRPTPMLPPAPAHSSRCECMRCSDVAPSEPAKFSFPIPPSSTEEWFDVPVDVDSLFDSIRLADAMMIEAEDAEDAEPESTQRSRIAQVADRCNGGES